MIAALGDFEFEVSENYINTFKDLRFSNSAQYSEHKILGRRGLLEFTGLNASSCSLTIHLDAGYVDDLPGIIAFYNDAMISGDALLFMLGDSVMGEGFWVIESFDESYTQISNKGEFLSADLSLRLKEYIDDAD